MYLKKFLHFVDYLLLIVLIGMMVGILVPRITFGESNGEEVVEITEDVDLQSGFDNGEKFYLRIYKSVKTEPRRIANKRAAESLGIGELEAERIGNGDLSAVMQPNMTIDERTIQTQAVLKRYNQILDDVERENSLAMQIRASEIFNDGNINNSGGFDLVDDLKTIQILLFGVASDNEPYGGTAVDIKLPESLLPSAAPGQNGSGGSNGQSGQNGGGDTDNPNVPSSDDDNSNANGDFHGSICATQDDLSSLIEEFEIDNGINRNADINRNQGDDSDGPSQSPTAALADYDDQLANRELPELAPQNWVEPNVCNDVFCLEVNFVTSKVSAGGGMVGPADKDCIFCHIRQIKLDLEETTSHHLTPNKVSGNLIEDAVCKNQEKNLKIGLNIIPVAVPIKTPPNNDLVVRTFTQDKEALQDIFKLDFTSKENPRIENLSIQDRAAKNIGGSVSRSTSTTALINELSLETANLIAQREQSIDDFNTKILTGNGITNFQTISQQITTMQQSFNSINTLLEQMATSDDSICTNIRSKPDQPE